MKGNSFFKIRLGLFVLITALSVIFFASCSVNGNEVTAKLDVTADIAHIAVNEKAKVNISARSLWGEDLNYTPDDVYFMVCVGEKENIEFEDGRVSFEKDGEYGLAFFSKKEKAKSSVVKFYVTDEAHVLYAKIPESGKGDYEKEKSQYNENMSDEQRELEYQKLIDEAKSHQVKDEENKKTSKIEGQKGVVLEQKVSLDLKPFYKKGDDYAEIILHYLPVISVRKDFEVMKGCMNVEYVMGDKVEDVSCNAILVPSLAVMEYSAYLGDAKGEKYVDKMLIDDYKKATLEKPDDFILNLTYKMMLYPKELGRCEVKFNLINPFEPGESLFEEKYLLVAE